MFALTRLGRTFGRASSLQPLVVATTGGARSMANQATAVSACYSQRTSDMLCKIHCTLAALGTSHVLLTYSSTHCLPGTLSVSHKPDLGYLDGNLRLDTVIFNCKFMLHREALFPAARSPVAH